MDAFLLLLRRLAKDERGVTAQAALLIALIAAVAGYGMLRLGDKISNDFGAAAAFFALAS